MRIVESMGLQLHVVTCLHVGTLILFLASSSLLAVALCHLRCILASASSCFQNLAPAAASSESEQWRSGRSLSSHHVGGCGSARPLGAGAGLKVPSYKLRHLQKPLMQINFIHVKDKFDRKVESRLPVKLTSGRIM